MSDHIHYFAYQLQSDLISTFWDETLWLSLAFLIPLAALYQVLIIWGKRVKTIQAYDKARGLLLEGNSYHSALAHYLHSAPKQEDFHDRFPTDFSLVIARLDERKRIEVEKKNSNFFWIKWFYIVGTFSLLFFFGLPEFVDNILEDPRLVNLMASIQKLYGSNGR